MSTLDIFWSKLSQKWGRVGINFGKKIRKFKNNPMSMAVKIKNVYYINLTFDRVIIPLQSMVNDVVENFFFTAILIELCLNFGDNKTFEKLEFLFKVNANPTPFLG